MKNIIVKRLILLCVICSLLANCATAQTKNDADTYKNIPVEKDDVIKSIPVDAANTYKDIPVEVIGIPYSYKDICGNHKIDYVIDYQYNMHSTGQRSTFINFKINKFVYNFKSDGSLIFSAVYSYDKTPSTGNRFYPAADKQVHEWNLKPDYHNHGGANCSLDRYDDIAISQAKLNEMKKDSSLKKVYDVLYSVAQDMSYDHSKIGEKVKFAVPPKSLGVCEDYSNLLIKRLSDARIKGVSDITKVSGQNHAWVTLKYSGKLIYLDATWFQKQRVENGIYLNDRIYKDPRHMTFDNDIFTNHGKHHIPGGK